MTEDGYVCRTCGESSGHPVVSPCPNCGNDRFAMPEVSEP